MKILAVLLAIVICAATAATASATVSTQSGSAPVSSQVALDWNSYAVAAVRAAQTLDGVPVGVAPRALYQPEGLIYMAYVEAAVYDAVTKIDHRYRPYHHFEVGAGDASVEAAVASAAYATLVYYLGDPSGALAVHYADSIGALPADKRTARGIAVGRAAAADIVQLRAGDGLDAPTEVFGAPFVYTATNAGQWQVVPPFVAVGAQTPWVASMRPFTIETASQFRAPSQAALGSAQYAADFNETKDYGSATSIVRTPDETAIARFWNANVPSQQNQLYRDVAVQRGLDLVDAVHLMAMGSLTTADPERGPRRQRSNDCGPGLDAASLDAEPPRVSGSARLRHISSGRRARNRSRDADDQRDRLGCDRRRHDPDDDRALRHRAAAQGRGRQRPSLGRTALAQLSRRG